MDPGQTPAVCVTWLPCQVMFPLMHRCKMGLERKKSLSSPCWTEMHCFQVAKARGKMVLVMFGVWMLLSTKNLMEELGWKTWRWKWHLLISEINYFGFALSNSTFNKIMIFFFLWAPLKLQGHVPLKGCWTGKWREKTVTENKQTRNDGECKAIPDFWLHPFCLVCSWWGESSSGLCWLTLFAALLQLLRCTPES